MPGGRPPKLDDPVRQRRDGSTISAADHVLERIRLGADLDDAAAGANITPQTLWNWRRAGGNARAKHSQALELSPGEERYAQFLDDLEQAEAEAELARLQIVTQVAMGGWTIEKRMVKHQLVNGLMVEVERVEWTETAPPRWQPAAWFLERRFPEKYRRRFEMDATSSSSMSREDRARGIADAFREYLAGVDAGRELASSPQE